MPNTGEIGKSVETLRFAEMLSSFAQIPVTRAHVEAEEGHRRSSSSTA